MAVNTPKQDLQYILGTLLPPNYPVSPVGYYDSSTILPETPGAIQSPIDWTLYAIVKTITQSTDEAGAQFTVPQSNAERRALYTLVAARLTDMQTNLGAVISAINTYIGTLP